MSYNLTSVEAGSLKRGGLVQIKDKPCRIVDVKMVKTGKHGPRKCILTAVDLFTGKKHQASEKASNRVYSPVVDRDEGLLLGVEGGGRRAHVLGPNDEYLEDVLMPASLEEAAELAEQFEAGTAFVVSWLTAPVGPAGQTVSQIVSFRREG